MGTIANKRIENKLPPYVHPKSVHETLMSDKAFAPLYFYLIDASIAKHASRIACSDATLRRVADGMWFCMRDAPECLLSARAVKCRLRKLLKLKNDDPVGSADLEFYLVGVRDRLKLSKRIGLPSELEHAMDVVTETMVNSDCYRMGWQANIAVEFQDAFARLKKRNPSKADIFAVANEAADAFLTKLTNVGAWGHQPVRSR